MNSSADFSGSIHQNTPLSRIATRNVARLAPDESIGKAARIMAGKRISSIVVTDADGRPVGIVTERDLLDAMQSERPPETSLRETMSSPVVTVPESITCLDAYQICLRDGIRHLVIVDEGDRLQGVVSETDFRLHINLTALAGYRQVAAIMSRSVFNLPPETRLKEALDLMRSHRDNCVVVVEAECPVGIVTERDIVRLYSGASGTTDVTLREVMTSPVLTISLDDSINKAADLMLNTRVRHLVAVDRAGRLAGLISEHDLAHTMALGLINDRTIAEGVFLRTLIDTIPDLIWLKDTNGVYLACNRRFERFFGASEKEIAGKTDHDFVDGELAALFREHDRKVMDAGKPFINEEWITFADDGHRELLETIKAPMRDAYGKLIGVLGIARNITERKEAERLLSASEHKSKMLIELAGDAIFLADISTGSIIDCNKSATQLVGRAKEEIVGMHQSGLHPADKAEFYRELFRSHFRLGKGLVEDVQALHKDGHAIPVDINASTFELDGVPVMMAIFHDITERKLAEAEMRVAATAFEAQEGMLVTDAEQRIIRVNRAFTRITGYATDDVLGRNPRILSSGRHGTDYYEAMWTSLGKNGSWEGEIWNRRKSGEIYPEYLTISVVKDVNGRTLNYVATFNDISANKAAEEKIRNLAFYDPLTHLPNRRLLLDRLSQALASSARNGKRGGLLFIDLDNFKILNDTLGHAMGDELLQQAARRLTECVREGDTVSRLGGDEFVVILEDLSPLAREAAAQTEMVGNKILAALSSHYQLGVHEFRNTTSIGATLFDDHEQEIEALLKQADIAMYQAKKAGRNALRFFDPEMQEGINVRATLESELRKAIESRQFQLHYQIMTDEARRPFGAEALIRWNHPQRGIIPPGQFIPLAEETGLILPIGQWVLETACAQLKAWEQDARTRDISLSVNVSARQFRQGDFVPSIQDAVLRHAIRPGRLKLELTESMLLENVEEVIATMNALGEIGIGFSLDDFGTGYSSLQYLKRLPIDQLKIDQSFVRDLASDGSDKVIVRTIVAMAHSLGLNVIAEGVETEEQRQLLRSLHCTHFQGYLFGRPTPIRQFEDLLPTP